ncbi:carbohydrate sulfotransferase 11-like isoform X2 [Ischnura elegans]|uniref:carbohydrate sulfotransferase 11-like isoform X2 n=1 Tax=Ischnura elegans TaxID=197161 RepID=UPI001ED881FA|nr:carbohydrate sulfotransferase 11-like isoform X2 [Ischnura elegans]
MEGMRNPGSGPSFWGSLQRMGLIPGRRPASKQRPKALTVLFLLAITAYSLILLQQYSHYDAGAAEGPGLREFAQNSSRYTLAAALIGDASSMQKADDEGTAAAGKVTMSDMALEAELARRRSRVWQTCKANGLVTEDGNSLGEPNAWEFFVDDNHHLVWCNVFKAASSSWMYNFNLLGGYKEHYLRRSRKTPLSLARSRFPRPSVEQLRAALPHSLSFLIVRDPFERLLSAYRNKIEGFRHKFYRKMAKDIISRFRLRNPQMTPAMQRGPAFEKSPTFSEFVSWVIASAKEGAGGSQGGSQGIAGFDEHWAPYFRFCTPCAVNFTVVAKMETLTRDELYIIERAGIAGDLGLGDNKSEWEDEWRRRGKPREAVNAAIGGKTEDVLPRYFKTLTRRQLDDLYDIYRVDFQMFGYDASKYFKMVA